MYVHIYIYICVCCAYLLRCRFYIEEGESRGRCEGRRRSLLNIATSRNVDTPDVFYVEKMCGLVLVRHGNNWMRILTIGCTLVLSMVCFMLWTLWAIYVCVALCAFHVYIDLHYIAYNFIFVCFYDCSHVYSIFSFLISCLIVHALIFLVLYII